MLQKVFYGFGKLCRDLFSKLRGAHKQHRTNFAHLGFSQLRIRNFTFAITYIQAATNNLSMKDALMTISHSLVPINGESEIYHTRP